MLARPRSPLHSLPRAPSPELSSCSRPPCPPARWRARSRRCTVRWRTSLGCSSGSRASGCTSESAPATGPRGRAHALLASARGRDDVSFVGWLAIPGMSVVWSRPCGWAGRGGCRHTRTNGACAGRGALSSQVSRAGVHRSYTVPVTKKGATCSGDTRDSGLIPHKSSPHSLSSPMCYDTTLRPWAWRLGIGCGAS